MLETVVVMLLSPINIIVIAAVLFVAGIYLKDKYQSQHSVVRTHPILGRLRYLFEFVGKPFRQYWFNNDKEGKPIDRDTAETIAKASKYGDTIRSFGSVRDFSLPGFYLANSMFPKNLEELKVDQSDILRTRRYHIEKEKEFSRKEHQVSGELKPWHLPKEEAVVLGPERKYPFVMRGLVGVAGMSFGALSAPAVKALTQGVALSGGSWINTGEGGISDYHLTSIYEVTQYRPSDERFLKVWKSIRKQGYATAEDIKSEAGDERGRMLKKMTELGYIKERQADLMYQLGSGLYGSRNPDGTFSEELFRKNAAKPQVKAIEVKLAQGAKTKGGHVEGAKVTPEIAEIRGVEPWKTIASPNRFKEFHDVPSLFQFVHRLQELSQKPVGIKIVMGNEYSLDPIAQHMKDYGIGPDFITVDGGNGGTGATFQEMADSLGLPVYSAVMAAHNSLEAHGVRDRVKIIASGMLSTSDCMSIALGLGADAVNVARAAMNTIGCINAQKCHTNECPVGVTTHKPHLQRGLVVEEKRFRTANYLTTMRKGMYSLTAACGVDSPTKLTREHVTFKYADGSTVHGKQLRPYIEKEQAGKVASDQ